MFAEIITIGDELLIGQVVDTNSAWMGQELNKIGIEVLRIVSIRDREEEIMEAVDNAMKRVNIVLVTGGLGPTKDDITKQTLCKYFHTELIFSEEVFENVKTSACRKNTDECAEQEPGNGSQRLHGYQQSGGKRICQLVRKRRKSACVHAGSSAGNDNRYDRIRTA